MPFGRENNFSNGKISLSIPSGALYDTLYFKYSTFPGDQRMFSDIYQIGSRFTPLHKPFTLNIWPDSVPSGAEEKLVLVRVDENGSIFYAGGTYSRGLFTAELPAFGAYAISIDTIPPDISSNGFTDGSDLSQKSSIRLKITDNLSGIKTYTGTIDDKWVLFEYDAKNNLISYKFDEKRLQRGIGHKLVVTVTDNRNNSQKLIRNFKW